MVWPCSVSLRTVRQELIEAEASEVIIVGRFQRTGPHH